MKRILALAAFLSLFSLVGHAQELVGYFTGAWYETSVRPSSTRPREAGQLDLYVYDNGQVLAEVFYDGESVGEVVGWWTYSTRTRKFKISFNNGSFTYAGGGTSMFWSGTFAASFPGVRVRGRWQAN